MTDAHDEIPQPTNLEIIQGLADIARGLALDFLGRFPEAVFTSGRRDIADQAEAMAANVVLNRNWIRETYRISPLSAACQSHVNELGPHLTQEDLANGFRAVMNLSDPSQLRLLSWHLIGQAFDIQPTTELKAHADYLRQLVSARITDGGIGKVLTMEGGLCRLHIQIA